MLAQQLGILEFLDIQLVNTRCKSSTVFHAQEDVELMVHVIQMEDAFVPTDGLVQTVKHKVEHLLMVTH